MQSASSNINVDAIKRNGLKSQVVALKMGLFAMFLRHQKQNHQRSAIRSTSSLKVHLKGFINFLDI